MLSAHEFIFFCIFRFLLIIFTSVMISVCFTLFHFCKYLFDVLWIMWLVYSLNFCFKRVMFFKFYLKNKILFLYYKNNYVHAFNPFIYYLFFPNSDVLFKTMIVLVNSIFWLKLVGTLVCLLITVKLNLKMLLIYNTYLNIKWKFQKN